ncbi:MAG: aminofutalosine synthase MqnE [Proteobacteria bacterium]|nr:aminofutalosine synthase MqnE [Pseudomonadota bacterium]
MKITCNDTTLIPIAKKVEAGERLSFEDGKALYLSQDLISIGNMANQVRKKRYGNTAYFIYNQHINYTNVCSNMCSFCAYAEEENSEKAYTWSVDQIKQRIMDRIEEPIRELHIVGGLNRSLPFSYFTDMLAMIRQIRPTATIKAFTAVEIDYLSALSGASLEDTVLTLKQAGLMMMPGGGAEVMSDRVHDNLFPKKIGKDRWLEVTEAVHRTGLKTNATMLYGHIETLDERVNHLLSLRTLQDRTSGFSAFIPLAFHSQNTKLSHIPTTNAFDDLKTIAISRLILDNIPHIKAYWVMIGEKLAQTALFFGADDLDGTIIEERITHTAGAKSAKGLSRKSMEHLITSAGLEPVERDSFYNDVRDLKGEA